MSSILFAGIFCTVEVMGESASEWVGIVCILSEVTTVLAFAVIWIAERKALPAKVWLR